MKNRWYKGIAIGVAVFFVFAFSACGEEKTVVNSNIDVDYIGVRVEESLFENKLYYEQLNEEEKQVYREIYQGFIDQAESFAVHSLDGEKAGKICSYVVYDFAEIFWVDGSCEMTIYEGSHVVMKPNYTYSNDKKIEMQSQIEAAADEIIKTVPQDASEYETIKYIYESLVNQVDYVENAPDNQNIYSALVNKKTVCAGYAKANQYLLNKLGIYCAYVTGTAKGSAHAWNIVQCDGNYYYVDVTWADPLFAGGARPADGEMVYDYLCCSETVIAGTHVAESGIDYPVCDSNDLNYYEMNGISFASPEKEELLSAMQSSIDHKEASTTLKFADSSSYEKAKQSLKDSLLEEAAKYLAQKYSLEQVQYSYEDAADLNKIVIYWKYE